MKFDVTAIRRQFPLLAEKIGEDAIVYLDSAATSQKPKVVLDAMRDFYETANGNPHRGMHILAERSTEAYEGARETVKEFINAKSSDEIIFTKSTTESINLVARSLGTTFNANDTVLISVLEHHSNIVPWLQLKEEKKIDVQWIEIDGDGCINVESIGQLLQARHPKLVAITGLSNVLGCAPDLKSIIELAHVHNAMVLIDAAQMAAHMPIDVQDLDCDFLAFSGHKIYGPTGIGVLYGKKKILELMPPFLGGGMMIREVTRDHFTSADLPAKFEAGTAPVAEAVGLQAAIEWQTKYDWKDRMQHEAVLLSLVQEELSKIPGLSILGIGNSVVQTTRGDVSAKKNSNRHGCISFVIDGIHPHDLTDLLGQKGICLRAGHHCAQPLHERLGINASARLSVSIHTTEEEILAVRPAILAAMNILKKS